MDPFVETSAWASAHYMLISEIIRQLTPLLRPNYVATPVERLVTMFPQSEEALSIVAVGDQHDEGVLYPDVTIARSGPETTASSATAVLAPVQVATVMPEKIPQVGLEILDRRNRQLVTAIEVLSPTNKRGDGRDEYLQGRSRYLLSSAHLVEIDLLRDGERPPMRGRLPSTPYYVFVSRAWKRPICDVYPINLADPLPKVSIPLFRRDENVELDLQRAFTEVYDQGALDLVVDYDSKPDAKLTAAEREWVKGVLSRRQ